MGRSQESWCWKHFQVNKEKNSATCKVDGCKFTSTQARGLHAGNLVAHVKRCHRDVFVAEEGQVAHKKRKEEESLRKITDLFQAEGSSKMKPVPLAKTVVIEFTKDVIEDLAVQAVTVDGLPLSFFSKPSIKKLMSPVLTPFGLTLHQEKVRSLVMATYAQRKADLSQMMRGKLVCLKVDLCTRNERHFLGINVQFVSSVGFLRSVTLKTHEMNKRATANELKNVILDVLSDFGLMWRDLYSMTMDNGSNVVACAKLIGQEIMDDLNEEDFLNKSTDSGGDDDGDEMDEVVLDALKQIPSVRDGLVPVRCAVHTLQLAVEDAFRKDGVAKIFDCVRLVVKKLRTPSNRLLLKQKGCLQPMLDVPTRWGSKFLMLKRLLEMRAVVTELSRDISDLDLTEDEWKTIERTHRALKPVYEATVILQKENLSPGEFLGRWKTCKATLMEAEKQGTRVCTKL